MARLQPYQVAAAALLGGFPPGEVPTAVAVAKGESGYSTTSRNACCSGLWQIHRTAHADKIAAAGGVDKLTDPVVNARLAYQVWAGDWCGSRAPNGRCAKYEAYGLGNAGMSWQAKVAEGARAYAEVQRRQQAGESLQSMVGSAGASVVDAALPGTGTAGAVLDAGSAIAAAARSMIDFGNRLGRWISSPDNWIRVAEVIGGGLLVAVGLRIAFHAQYMAAARKVVSAVTPGKGAARAGAVRVRGRA